MIAPATLADLPAIVALETAAMGDEAWSSALVSDELAAADRGSRVVLVSRGGHPDGEIEAWCDLAVAADTADTADLLRVAVHPASRRAGIATSLLAAADDALPRSVERVLLEVAEHNVAARALYERRGYTEIARRARYYRDGSAAVVMQRDRQRAQLGQPGQPGQRGQGGGAR